MMDLAVIQLFICVAILRLSQMMAIPDSWIWGHGSSSKLCTSFYCEMLTVAVIEVKQGVNYMFLQHHLIACGDYQTVHCIMGYIVNVLFSLQAPQTSYRNNKHVNKQQDTILISHQP